jgi:hypothetical protein
LNEGASKVVRPDLRNLIKQDPVNVEGIGRWKLLDFKVFKRHHKNCEESNMMRTKDMIRGGWRFVHWEQLQSVIVSKDTNLVSNGRCVYFSQRVGVIDTVLRAEVR